MTCIVGLVHGGNVYLGGDSAGVSGNDITLRSDLKVFTNGPFIMGFTSSFRMGQLLQYKLKVPNQKPTMEDMEYMVVVFVEAVRICLKEGGYVKKDNERESSGTFLVGYKGRLFCVDSDFQVGEARCGYDAVGSGEDYAKGALSATDVMGMSPEPRITLALEAAEAHNAGVRGPFTIISN